MITSQDFLDNKIIENGGKIPTMFEFVTLMEQYGEYCVNRILKLASENAVVSINGIIQEYDENCCVDKNSILNTKLKRTIDEFIFAVIDMFGDETYCIFLKNTSTHYLEKQNNIDDYKNETKKILKDEHGIVVNVEDIKFEWLDSFDEKELLFDLQPKIEFIESHSFFGEQFSLKVDNKIHMLEKYTNPQINDYKQQAVKILLELYGISYKLEDVKFVWDNTL